MRRVPPWVIVGLASVIALAAACSGGGGGSTGDDDSSDDDDGTTHPAGFAAAAVHGVEANRQEQDCRTCHGTMLDGGISGVGCDTCHASGWRTNCTYCHGGTDNATGAPPQDMNNATDLLSLTFRAHTQHVTPEATHVAYDCVQCHVKPTGALDAGHWFDATPGAAEVVFTGGLNAGGGYNGFSTCSNSYCHGTGAGSNGSVQHTQSVIACNGGCHAGLGSLPEAWSTTMTGKHWRHLTTTMGGTVTCYECHASTLASNNTINNVGNHLNGSVENQFPGTNIVLTTGGVCNGSCHGFTHTNEMW